MDKEFLIEKYKMIRKMTLQLCNPLINEDYIIQAMPDVSPPKWHLAHTTWFFETFILIPQLKNYRVYDSYYNYLFNSYYHGKGKPYPRNHRGKLARPTVDKVIAYRHYVDNCLLDYFGQLSEEEFAEVKDNFILGIHHEQQHQELLLMDIKYNFFQDPTFPTYTSSEIKNDSLSKLDYIEEEGGLIKIGADKNEFCFDNELPSHTFYLKPYQVANRLVTNGEFLEFIEAKGYEHPKWWLIDGWNCIKKKLWQAPLYWVKQDNHYYHFTLHGLQKLNLNEPVIHMSYYEADAYARFKNKRLLTEFEWETYVIKKNQTKQIGNFVENNFLHPIAADKNNQQFFGDAWEWTASSYTPYPGFRPLAGTVGEYNGKFMSNQMVLRGGSCLTSSSHIRTSYRNYFQLDKRWQFSGIRLASD